MVFWILSGIAVWFIVGYIHAEAVFQLMKVRYESPTAALMDLGDDDVRRRIKDGEPVHMEVFSVFAALWPLVIIMLIFGVIKQLG